MKRTILAVTLLGAFGACTVEVEGSNSSSDEGDDSIDAGTTDDDDDQPGPPDAAPPALDLTAFCNQWNAAVCTHLFACLTAAEREAAGIPATEEECTSAQAADCEDVTSETYCASGQTYAADQEAPCLTQFADLTCDQFRDPDHDAVLAAAAPACVAMCQ